MSVNIIVNGKYVNTNRPKHSFFNDPDQIVKENEERRKIRIQQVRNASKNIAKEVRNNLELEKEKQLKKMEEIKASEMNEWRGNVLAQKGKNFRSSLSQVGTAHHAAQVENFKETVQKKKKMPARVPLRMASKIENKENVLKNTSAQKNTTDREIRQDLTSKSKSDECENGSEWETSSINSSFSSSSSSSSTKTENVSKSNKENESKLASNPILLEFEQIQSDNSEVDPKKLGKSSDRVSKDTYKIDESEALKGKTIQEKALPQPAKLRFTQISDIILQQKVSEKTNQQPNQVPKLQGVGKSNEVANEKSPNVSQPSLSQNAKGLSSKTSSSRSTNTKVQFFDYKNKFHKQYEPPSSIVELHEAMPDKEMDAMQTAAHETKLQQSREAEINKLRQKSSERCQKAVEKEQVRRSCEELTAKLDALTKQRQPINSDNYQFAQHQIDQTAKVKETKLNTAVEDILKRQAIITCPVADPLQSGTSSSDIQPNYPFFGLNVNTELKEKPDNSLNSSESCCSILLGRVDDQSKQIAEDIQKLNKQNKQIDSEKARKLQNLLSRINNLRDNLMQELEKCSNEQAFEKDRARIVMDSICDLKKEHENILATDDPINSIEKRENDLKKKEAALMQKVREFYEMQKADKQAKYQASAALQSNDIKNKTKDNKKQKETLETDKSNKTDIQSNQNDEIRLSKDFPQKEKVINGNNECSSSEGESIQEEFTDRRKLLVGGNPLEIVIKVKGESTMKKIKKKSPKSPKTLSSLIQPIVIKKHRTKIVVASNDSTSTSYRSLPTKIHNNVDKIINNIPEREPDIMESPSNIGDEEKSFKKNKKKRSNLNPLMAHYVQRLLCMSRTSIKALGVSSSEIDSPSNSIIDTTANLSAAETEKLATQKLKNVQQFISDNYSFVGELEETLRQSKCSDSSNKTEEVNWKKVLKDDQNEVTRNSEAKKTIKPSLKNCSKKQNSQRRFPCANKSTQKTDNCTQRIAELTQMINQVRKEKQKILESTLSSTSENGRNSTEYLDLPGCHNVNAEYSNSQVIKSIDNLQSKMPAPVDSDHFVGLEKDKHTGMSRDSGISLSRPITVQEIRESPLSDVRHVQSSTESNAGHLKNPKPPISISRYSPQLAEEVPHELSTIFEVETPATSKRNTSVHAHLGHDIIHQLTPSTDDSGIEPRNPRIEQIVYRKFPSFEEYARMHNLDLTQFDPEFSLRFEKEFNEFINFAKVGKNADYEQFTSLSNYIAKSSASDNKEAGEELLASLKLANLSFKRFPTRSEYLNKLGLTETDLLDSQSLDNMESKSSVSSSSSSLINIENELKLRNIIEKPFEQQSKRQDDKELTLIGSSFSLQNKRQIEMSGFIELSSGTVSIDEQSTNLEDELKKIGIKWPSAMKKKTIETQALSSSSLSNAEVSSETHQRKSNNSAKQTGFRFAVQTSQDGTIQSEDVGKQLNLREFLKKELVKRATTSSSVSFSDDSVASSILRSILGSITPSGPYHKQQNNELGPTLERHKTSTPMASQSLSSSKEDKKSQVGTSFKQLFSDESRLSSVHLNNNSTNVSNTPPTKKA